MNVSLTKSLEKFVKQQVDIGMYNSTDEVISAGLWALKNQKIDLQERKKIALKQVENGDYYDANDEEFWKNLEASAKKRP